MNKKLCPECLIEFTCLAYEGKCWCENLKIEPEKLENSVINILHAFVLIACNNIK